MGKPLLLLERICAHAMSFGANAFETERVDGWQRAFAQIDGERTRIVNFKDASGDAEEFRSELSAAAEAGKPLRTLIEGKAWLVEVRAVERSGAKAFDVRIDPLPASPPSVAPAFTAKQGQYLAFIYNYTKIHGCAPAHSDLQFYFRVSPPAVNDMIKTLARNGLIEITPGQARSIRLLVAPEHLPRLK